MGLAKIITKLGIGIASKAPKWGGTLQSGGERLRRIELFTKDYLKNNKKQLIGTFGLGLTAGGLMFRGCSYTPEEPQQSQPPKKAPAEYKVCVRDNDTLTFKSKQNAENFVKLYKEFEKAADEQIDFWQDRYYSSDRKEWRKYYDTEKKINADFDKKKQPYVSERDNAYHKIDSVRDANRAIVDKKFKEQTAPLDSLRNVKLKENEDRFNATPEGVIYNEYNEAFRQKSQTLWNAYDALKKIYKPEETK